jgi:hypothetical protein
MMISKPGNKQPEPNTKQLLLATGIWDNLIHSIIQFHSFSPSLTVVSQGPANLILKLTRPGNQLMITDCHAIHRHCCRQGERQKEREAGREGGREEGEEAGDSRTNQLRTANTTFLVLKPVAASLRRGLRLVLEKCSYSRASIVGEHPPDSGHAADVVRGSVDRGRRQVLLSCASVPRFFVRP